MGYEELFLADVVARARTGVSERRILDILDGSDEQLSKEEFAYLLDHVDMAERLGDDYEGGQR